MCTNRFTQLLEEHGTEPSSSVDYCILLKVGNGESWVDEYDEYENNFYDGDKPEEIEEMEYINSRIYDYTRKCAIFGHLHLNRFQTNVPENCAIAGAYPLFDSRPREGCVPIQQIYLADAGDPGPIAGTFQDGTNEIGEHSNKKSVKILVYEEGIRADVILYHLDTTVRIRKFGNKFLSVFIEASTKLLENQNDHHQICTHGCRQRNEFKGDTKISQPCIRERSEIEGN
uniref:Repulsive guidance molecule C-terminal domain-containing protein n=1 Tax=Meloidogyne javanica TaxID=6303 RepID=A0A915MBY4_MELJA